MKTEREIAELLGALELEIVPPFHDVSKCLATLQPNDARKARRKFRKLKKKIDGHSLMKAPKIRSLIREECYRVGMRLLAGQGSKVQK